MKRTVLAAGLGLVWANWVAAYSFTINVGSDNFTYGHNYNDSGDPRPFGGADCYGAMGGFFSDGLWYVSPANTGYVVYKFQADPGAVISNVDVSANIYMENGWAVVSYQVDTYPGDPGTVDWLSAGYSYIRPWTGSFQPNSNVVYLAIWGANNGSAAWMWALQMDKVELTVIPPPAVVQGTVVFDGFRGDYTTQGVKLEFQPTGEGPAVTKTAYLDADGKFSVTDIPRGTYTLGVRGGNWLGTSVNVSVAGNPTVIAEPIVLSGGDINGDDTVSFEDFSILQNSYGQSGAGANPLAAVATGGCGELGLGLLMLVGLALRWRE